MWMQNTGRLITWNNKCKQWKMLQQVSVIVDLANLKVSATQAHNPSLGSLSLSLSSPSQHSKVATTIFPARRRNMLVMHVMPFSWAGPFSSSFLFVRVGVKLVCRKVALLVFVLVLRSSLLWHFSCHMFQHFLRTSTVLSLPPLNSKIARLSEYLRCCAMSKNWAPLLSPKCWQETIVKVGMPDHDSYFCRPASSSSSLAGSSFSSSALAWEPPRNWSFTNFLALKSHWRTWSILHCTDKLYDPMCTFSVFLSLVRCFFLWHHVSAHRHAHFKSHHCSSKVFQE